MDGEEVMRIRHVIRRLDEISQEAQALRAKLEAARQLRHPEGGGVSDASSGVPATFGPLTLDQDK
jgi:hypothetical protein